MAGTNETRHWSEEKNDFSSAFILCQGRDSYGEYHIQNAIKEVSLAYNTQTVLVTVHSQLKNQACAVESIDSLIIKSFRFEVYRSSNKSLFAGKGGLTARVGANKS